MSSTIFIPKKIKVGFQNRTDTYTQKLAYVIYYDEHNKLRKEASWENWRDKKIEPEEFENEPTTGFVLNKKVGGYCNYYNNMRQAYVRIFDPRGFEFEVTVPNLLYILENANSIKGKGLEGEFVYGWDGKDLVLIPVDSPDYKDIKSKSEKLTTTEYIKPSELKIGRTYKDKNDKLFVYMGKFDYWDYEANCYIAPSRWSCGRGGWEKPVDETWKEDKTAHKKILYRNVNKGKKFWFARPDCNNSFECFVIDSFSSVGKKFYEVAEEKVHEKFAEFQNKMEHDRHYSPIDFEANRYEPVPFEKFSKELLKREKYSSHWFNTYADKSVNLTNDTEIIKPDTNTTDVVQTAKIRINKRSTGEYYISCEYEPPEIKLLFEGKNYADIKTLYEAIKPIHRVIYLKNGNVKEGGYYY